MPGLIENAMPFRTLAELLRRAGRLPEAPAMRWRDRRRLVEKRARAIDYSRGKAKKRVLYRQLIAAVQATRAELQTVVCLRLLYTRPNATSRSRLRGRRRPWCRVGVSSIGPTWAR
jgi:hypothetical protein